MSTSRKTCTDAGGVCRWVVVRDKITKKVIRQYCRLCKVSIP